MAIDLRQVWVCGESAELIRADQIVSVGMRSDGEPCAANWLSMEGAGVPVWLGARVLGDREGTPVRYVNLLECPGRDAVRLALELVESIAAATTSDSGTCHYIFPIVDHYADLVRWEGTGRLSGWPKRPVW
jgi:hypothetical protein